MRRLPAQPPGKRILSYMRRLLVQPPKEIFLTFGAADAAPIVEIFFPE
jgi:hypothetical protein